MISAIVLAQSLAIANVSVLTMEDGATHRRAQTVVVDNGIISAVGPAASTDIPATVRRIDGTGMVLLPGLADMHVHLEAEPASWVHVFLRSGVTTVLNLRGNETHLALRARIARGELRGPTVYTSGPYVNRPQVESELDALRAAREQKSAGYDVIKIHGPLGNLAYRALLDSAQLPVVGHAPRNLPLDTVIARGQQMIAHAEELIYTKFTALDTLQIGDIPQRMSAAKIWLTPTLSTFHGIAEQWGRKRAADSAIATDDAAFFNAELKRYWLEANPYTGRSADGAEWAFRAYEFQRTLVQRLHRAGVRLLAGTDTPVPVMIPGTSIHLELAELERAGLARYDVLMTATRNPGDFIGELIDRSVKVGRVAVGYRADLLLVAGDPLVNLGVLRKPAKVVARGVVVVDD